MYEWVSWDRVTHQLRFIISSPQPLYWWKHIWIWLTSVSLRPKHMVWIILLKQLYTGVCVCVLKHFHNECLWISSSNDKDLSNFTDTFTADIHISVLEINYEFLNKQTNKQTKTGSKSAINTLPFKSLGLYVKIL